MTLAQLSRSTLLLAIALQIFSPSVSRADYTHRFSLGFGIVTMTNPSQTDFEIGAEYEYHPMPLLGFGVAGNYIFSDPSITLLAFPDIFLHPLDGDWVISGSPLFEFESGLSTQVGVRVGTRVPVPLGALTLVPSVAVDFINGGRDYWFGLGLEF